MLNIPRSTFYYKAKDLIKIKKFKRPISKIISKGLSANSQVMVHTELLSNSNVKAGMLIEREFSVLCVKMNFSAP